MRNLYQLFSERARDFLCTWGKRRFDAHIVVSGKSRSFRSGDLSLRRVFGIRVSVILGCLSICECDKALVRDVQDISIHEYSWGPHMAMWYPSTSRPVSLMVNHRLHFSCWYMTYPSALVALCLEGVVGLSRILRHLLVK